jgi:hypothetical protein
VLAKLIPINTDTINHVFNELLIQKMTFSLDFMLQQIGDAFLYKHEKTFGTGNVKNTRGNFEEAYCGKRSLRVG